MYDNGIPKTVIPDEYSYYPGIDGMGMQIVDKVQIPAHLEKGEYILNWRMDCEQATQIYENCADITIA